MILSASSQALLAFALNALALYFTLLVALSLHRYVRFRRMRGTGLVTWRRENSWRQWLWVLLGLVSALVALPPAAEAPEVVLPDLPPVAFWMSERAPEVEPSTESVSVTLPPAPASPV